MIKFDNDFWIPEGHRQSPYLIASSRASRNQPKRQHASSDSGRYTIMASVLLDLPTDTWGIVVGHLDACDLAALRATSRGFRDIVDHFAPELHR